MLQIAIKIELSNLDKAMVEIKALEKMVLDLANTYPTTFVNACEEDVKAPAPKRTPVKRAKKAVKEPETPKEVKEVVEEPKAVKTATEVISLEELTAIAKEMVGKAGRDTVKATVEQFSETAKLSGVLPEKRDELATALKAL